MLLLLLLLACTENTLKQVDATPVATILSPVDGSSSLAGTALALRGSASDADDATTTLLARWLVNDVEVCADAAPAADGTTLCTVTPDAGSDVVQLEVRDPSEAVGVDTISVTVTIDTPPTVSISAPVDGSTIRADGPVDFQGLVTDVEDAADALVVAWNDDVDGPISGVPLSADGTALGSATFSTGDHVLTLSATDSGGNTSEASVSFTVLPPNSPPSAPGVLIAPSDPVAGDSLVCQVATPSTDADGDPVTYVYAWDVDGTAYTDTTTTTGPGDTVPAGITTVGETWTCTVTPNDGIDDGPTGSDTVTVGSASLCPDGNCALRFDGGSDYVEVPDAPTLEGGGRALTVEAWVYYDSVTSNCMTTVRKGTSASATYDYWLHKNYSPGDSLYWGSWTGWTAQAFGAITAGSWYHYAGTYDPASGTAAIWINGAMLSSTTASGTPTANADPLRIGIDWDLGCDTWGVIDEVRISDTVRYTAPFTPETVFTPDADTMALWHFDEYTGTTATDSSGNGNDGVIHGAAWTTESP